MNRLKKNSKWYVPKAWLVKMETRTEEITKNKIFRDKEIKIWKRNERIRRADVKAPTHVQQEFQEEGTFSIEETHEPFQLKDINSSLKT